jgi:hypothetical protein
VQLGPEAERALVLGGDEREVAVDAAPDVHRVAQLLADVTWLVAHVAGHRLGDVGSIRGPEGVRGCSSGTPGAA